MLGSVAAVSGCPDPSATFDEFTERYDNIYGSTTSGTGGSGGAGPACTAPDEGVLDGKWILSISAVIKKERPLVFLLEVTTTPDGDGLKMTLEATPLAAADQKTAVGSPIPLGEYPVAADGTFTADLGALAVTGMANPITGSDIEAEVTLTGSVCNETPDFACGTAGGQVTKPTPLDLTGSTFAWIRITDEANYPLPVLDCKMTPPKFM